MRFLDAIGQRLARYLARPRQGIAAMPTSSPQVLADTLQKGDVLLVDGSSRFSVAIKYLTQSSWSHAALYVGNDTLTTSTDGEAHVLIDVDVVDGVRSLPLSEFALGHTRICRPVGLGAPEIDQLIDYARSRLGNQYNLRNIVDLARYLITTPPVPSSRRRRMLAFGSGDPTRAICSTLIAQAFQSVHYPILPEVTLRNTDASCRDCVEEILHIRHYSLFTPRDFDISPYFQIVKPVLQQGFDPHMLHWEET